MLHLCQSSAVLKPKISMCDWITIVLIFQYITTLDGNTLVTKKLNAPEAEFHRSFTDDGMTLVTRPTIYKGHLWDTAFTPIGLEHSERIHAFAATAKVNE